MISNIQHQNIEGVVKEILRNSTDDNENSNFINNNNTQKNKNLSIMMTTAATAAPPNMDATSIVMNFNSTRNGFEFYDTQNGYNKSLTANSLTLNVNNDDKLLSSNIKNEIESSEIDETKDSVKFTAKINANNIDDNMKNHNFLNDDAKLKNSKPIIDSSINVNSTPKKSSAKKIDVRCALTSNQQSSDSTISDTKFISDKKNEKRLQNNTKSLHVKNVDQIIRRIEDVHNYSKLSRCDESTIFKNCQDDEDMEGEEDDAEDIVEDVNNATKCSMKQKKEKNVHLNNKSTEISTNNMLKSKENSIDQSVNEAKNNYNIFEDEDKITPDHHTRRPMNAFLIFCKRHRAIVREKYKHLENRSITKILGDWWATLDAEEKKSYTNLAKQYKDAFFSANPNFKWYKLPAPPLRTLGTRPVKEESSLSESQEYENLLSDFNTPNNCNTQDGDESYNEETYGNNKNSTNRFNGRPKENKFSGVGSFKLADETQMGNLSSLMVQCSNPYKITLFSTPPESDDKTKNNNNTTVQEGNLAEVNVDDGSNNKCTTNKSGKRKTLDNNYTLNGSKRPMLSSDNSFSSGDEDIFQKKPTRSCKGKKYQEFLNSGQIIVSTKKSKSKTPHTNSHDFPHNNTYCKPLKFTSNEKSEQILDNFRAAGKYELESKNNISQQYSNLKKKKGHVKISPSSPITEDYQYEHRKHHRDNISLNSNNNNPGKQFDAIDFDLECKIRALPAQNLDNYLDKKKQTKKKKKINSKRHASRLNNNSTKSQSFSFSPPQVNIDQHNYQNASTMIVGSQKRKARKESITRRDVNSINNEVQSILEAMAISSSPNALTTHIGLEPSPDQHPLIEANAEESLSENLLSNENNATEKPNETDEKPDLLILAEVATNHIDVKKT